MAIKALALVSAMVIATSVEICSHADGCSTSEQGAPGTALLQTTRKHSSSASLAGLAKHNQSTAKLAINPSGAAAPLTNDGYLAVADRCCQGEMIQFIERAAMELNLDVCNAAGLRGIVPYHSCAEGPQSFEALNANLLHDSEQRCKWLAPAGQCASVPADCPEFPGTEELDCSCSVSNAAKLDFAAATKGQNNLGGQGPDTGAEEMRYVNVYPGVDLVITSLTAYEPLQGNGNAGMPDFMANGFGGLVVRWGTTTDFKFQFVDTGTSTPHVLDEVHMAFFDLDSADAGAEIVQGKGYNGYVTDLDTSLTASLSDGRTKFAGTQSVPNPTSPGVATDAQRKASVMFFFKQKSEFEIKFGFEPLGTFTAAGQQALLLFSGSSVLTSRCAA